MNLMATMNSLPTTSRRSRCGRITTKGREYLQGQMQGQAAETLHRRVARANKEFLDEGNHEHDIKSVRRVSVL
jgi:hypothetical protein